MMVSTKCDHQVQLGLLTFKVKLILFYNLNKCGHILKIDGCNEKIKMLLYSNVLLV